MRGGNNDQYNHIDIAVSIEVPVIVMVSHVVTNHT